MSSIIGWISCPLPVRLYTLLEKNDYTIFQLYGAFSHKKTIMLPFNTIVYSVIREWLQLYLYSATKERLRHISTELSISSKRNGCGHISTDCVFRQRRTITTYFNLILYSVVCKRLRVWFDEFFDDFVHILNAQELLIKHGTSYLIKQGFSLKVWWIDKMWRGKRLPVKAPWTEVLWTANRHFVSVKTNVSLQSSNEPIAHCSFEH